MQSPVRDHARVDASDNEATLSDVGSSLAASNIIDQYTYASSEAPSTPSRHSHNLAGVSSVGTLEGVGGGGDADLDMNGVTRAVAPVSSSASTSIAPATTAFGDDVLDTTQHLAPTPLAHVGTDMAKSSSHESAYSEDSSRAAFRSVEASPSLDTATGELDLPGGTYLLARPARKQSAPPLIRPPPRGKRPPPLASSQLSSAAPGTLPNEQGDAPAAASSSSSSSSRTAPLAGPAAMTVPGSTRDYGTSDDSNSDASHYDDQTEERGGMPPSTSSRTVLAGSVPRKDIDKEDEQDDAYQNAVDSPDVPLRRSSAHFGPRGIQRNSHESSLPSPTKSTRSSVKMRQSSSSFEQLQSENRRPSQPGSDAQSSTLPDRESTSSNVHSRKSSLATVEGPSEDASEFSARQQADMESQLAAAADPNRPRTLKEARALAKERAKQRLEAARGLSEDGATLSTLAPTVQTQDLADLADTNANARSKTPPESSMTGLGANTAKDGYNNGMSDLQAAVGDALQDLSFASSTATASSQGHETPHNRGRNSNDLIKRGDSLHRSSSLRPPNEMTQSFRDLDSESNTGASISSANFDSARESPIPPSPWSIALSVDSAAGADVPINPDEGASPQIAQAAVRPSQDAGPGLTTSMPHVVRGSSLVGQSFTSGHDVPATPTTPGTFATSFAPHSMQTQQRTTAPNKIARLDVYGKTIPWPPAFDPAAIIEQKRLAPWERARSYAHYCNDLSTTSTGLQFWIEMVQRPAQRQMAQQQQSQPIQVADTTHHMRVGSGTGPAPSIRSDMTFPMRGDGGRARELRGRGPTEATISESPADRLPPNLPYPLLAQKQQEQRHASPSRHAHSTSLGASTQLLRQQGNASADVASSSSSSVTNSDRNQSRNFFQSLGRRGSIRKTGGSGSAGVGISPALAISPRTGESAVATAFKGTSSGGALSPSISHPSFVQTESGVPPIPGVSPRLGGAKALASHDIHHTPGLSASTSMSTARASPVGPRPANPPGSAQLPSGALSPVSDAQNRPHIVTRASSAANFHESAFPDGTGRREGNNNMSPKNAPVPLPGVTPWNSGTKSSAVNNNVRRPSQGGNADDRLASSTSNAGFLGIAGFRRGSNGSTGHNAPAIKARGHAHDTIASNPTAEEGAALDKLSDVLPDAERTTLLAYLRQAGGNDLVAIGDYLQDRSKAEHSKIVG